MKLADPNFARLRILLSGRVQTVIDGELHIMRPGNVWMLDYSQEITDADEQSRQIGVFLPHDAIGFRPRRAVTKFDETIAIKRVLRDSVISCMTLIRQDPVSGEKVLAEGFCGLVRGLLAGGFGSILDPSVQQARAASMRKFLDDRLDDQTIGFDSLAVSFGASRSTIYRDFAEFGGVAAYIQRRRLRRTFEELSSSEQPFGAVSRAAERWHFNSASHLIRAFRSHFGVRPGEIVGTGLTPEAVTNGAADIEAIETV